MLRTQDGGPYQLTLRSKLQRISAARSRWVARAFELQRRHRGEFRVDDHVEIYADICLYRNGARPTAESVQPPEFRVDMLII